MPSPSLLLPRFFPSHSPFFLHRRAQASSYFLIPLMLHFKFCYPLLSWGLYLLFPQRPFHLLISCSNLLPDSTFNPSFSSCSPASYFVLPFRMYQTDITPPLGSRELVKTPIRARASRRAFLAAALHDKGDPSMQLASFHFLPFPSAAFRKVHISSSRRPLGETHVIKAQRRRSNAGGGSRSGSGWKAERGLHR